MLCRWLKEEEKMFCLFVCDGVFWINVKVKL